MLWRLKFPVGFSAGSTLTPVTTPLLVVGFERDFGETLAGVARHDVIGAFGYSVQSWRAPVQCEADGVENRGFSRARGTGNGEDAVVCVRRMS